MIRAYHFLKDDMTAGEGNEPAWRIGEERTIEGQLRLCIWGYHSSLSWYDALHYAPGNVACIVEVSEPEGRDADKQVSRTRKLIAARNVERELCLWGAECAERALLREREHGREADVRCWQAVEATKRYADGEATADELAVAWDAAITAAWAVAWDAAWAAAWAADRTAARAAAWAAARAATKHAARAAEIAWQRQRLDEILSAVFAEEKAEA